MTDMDKMLDKVRKLLALAGNNPSEKEAQAAALKAQKLIAQYNLVLSQDCGEKFIYKLVQAVHSNNEGYRKPLAVAIAENFRCKAIMVGNMVNFFGREADAEACVAAFSYLYRVSHNIGLKMEREARKRGENTHGVANSYWSGFIIGIKDALGEQSKALAIVVPEDVKDNFNKEFPNLREGTGGMRNTGFSYTAYNKGREDGRNSMGQRQLGG